MNDMNDMLDREWGLFHLSSSWIEGGMDSGKTSPVLVIGTDPSSFRPLGKDSVGRKVWGFERWCRLMDPGKRRDEECGGNVAILRSDPSYFLCSDFNTIDSMHRFYLLNLAQLERAEPSPGMRVVLYQEEAEDFSELVGCEAVLEFADGHWCAAPIEDTWFSAKGSLADAPPGWFKR